LLNTGSLPQEIVEEAARIDAPEDELSTDARSDELPPGLQTSADRRQRLRDAKHAWRDAKAGVRSRTCCTGPAEPFGVSPLQDASSESIIRAAR
jgi:hypothetical protein